MMRLVFLSLAAVVCILTGAGCAHGESTAGIPAVTGFEPERYMGRWYEIARLPHSFERGLDFVTAEYSLRKDGTIKVRNAGRRDGHDTSVDGVAHLAGSGGTGELRVSFFRPFYGDYRIIRLEPDYSAAIVTSSTRDYLWILSRTPQLAPDRLQDYRDRAAAWGFAVDRLEYPQQEAQP